MGGLPRNPGSAEVGESTARLSIESWNLCFRLWVKVDAFLEAADCDGVGVGSGDGDELRGFSLLRN